MTDDDLEAAVAAGILTASQRDALRVFAQNRQPLEADEERFRVLGGFNDILVAIGLGLLVAALLAASSYTGNGFAMALASVAIAWGLAEFFTRRLKLALPSILLSLMFVLSVTILAGGSWDEFRGAGLPLPAGLALAAAAGLHFWRFRVPIDGALIAAGLGVAFIGLLTEFWPDAFVPATLIAGLAVFTVAMVFDMADPLRRTRNSDIAFWLHLLAAPLIVHSVLSGFAMKVTVDETTTAIVILALVAGFALVALVVDRRAMLVSGLSYAGYSLWGLMSKLGGDEDFQMVLTLALLAVLVLAISAGWAGLRRSIVPILPLGGWRERLPPVRA